MDDIINLIATDAPASEISDAIKSSLFSKSAERVDSLRPEVASSVFQDNVESEKEE